jgi:DNA (cytosine-5)-methyltransferase 1
VSDKPRLLDLFCGAGGCGVGYSRAGFEVVGVDHESQPRYPFAFLEADALDTMRGLLAGATVLGWRMEDFSAIHASPPCQQYTPLRAVTGKDYPDLVAPVRDLLVQSGKPWVIENVPGAPLYYAIFLCGGMFGLRSYRHRRFEASFLMMQPEHPKHTVRVNRRKKNRRKHWDAGGFVTVVGDIGRYVGPEAMGIDWMTGNELSQAIPPPYTEHVGRCLLAALDTAP